MRVAARLARWLGPWTPETHRPRGVRRRRVRLRSDLDAWVYAPERGPEVGSLFVIPGLHYLGPADPRLDRFLAILAAAGLRVTCPFLPQMRALRVGPSTVDDVVETWDFFHGADTPAETPPGVLSISFGSYPAVHLALRRSTGPLVLFGGYADFLDAVRFSLRGDSGRPVDPLNRPVVFMTLLEYLDGAPEDTTRLRRAWVRFIRQTWGRPSMKERAAWEPIAKAIAERLPRDMRALFEVGVGLRPGGDGLVDAALQRARPELNHLDVRPLLPQLRRKTTVIHGREDDVIPFEHSVALAEAIPNARLLLTGWYGHTGAGGVSLGAIRGELRSMLGILLALSEAAGVKEPTPRWATFAAMLRGL